MIESRFLTFILLIFAIPNLVLAETKKEIGDLLDYCLDGQNHKTKPGPEDQLHRHCTPWKDWSCCTANTSVQVHSKDMYGFSYNHCGPDHTLSEACKRHFTQDLCFYECSPNIGPWVQKVNMKIRKERFYQVPLCAVDCDAWFNSCKNDFTCTDNWSRNFNWVNGVNHCPEGSTCRTFQEIFLNASNFCERVWDDSWKYTPDSEPCMRIWFNGSEGNPNAAVARWKATQMMNAAQSFFTYPWHVLSGILLLQFPMMNFCV